MTVGVGWTQVAGAAMAKDFFVYILASKLNGTLYIGVTSDLIGRTYTHREDLIAGDLSP